MDKVVRSRRLLVTGGSQLSPKAALLWHELGILLAGEDGLVLITGGLIGLVNSPAAQTADRAITQGFVEGLKARRIDPSERVETFLPDPKLDWSNLGRFEIGRVQVLSNRSAQARRFRMVYSSDVVIAIEGGRGTRSVLDVAMAIERPILPLPFGSGASEEVWREDKERICEAFQLMPDEVARLEQVHLAEFSEGEVRDLAKLVSRCVLRGFTSRCFVIMPFHHEFNVVYEQAVIPALAVYKFQTFRTDKDLVAGNIVEVIRDGLRHCFFAIADTTGDRPNVMYELGMAHAHQKPVILLRQTKTSDTLSSIPFDLRTESVLLYENDMDDLRRRLEACVSALSGRKLVNNDEA